MAENMSSEASTMAMRLRHIAGESELDAVRAWVSRRMKTKTDEQLLCLLEATDRLASSALKKAVRSTVEIQSVEIGNQRYTVRPVAIPVSISSHEVIEQSDLRIDHLVPAIQRTLVDAGLIPAKGGGITLLTHLVAHEQLRAMSYAQMFDISRQIFYSAIVAGGGRRRIEGLPTPSEARVQQIASKSLFTGYLLGCLYVRAGAKPDNRPRPEAVPAAIGQMLRASLSTGEMLPDVRTGRLLSVYDAIEAGALEQVRAAIFACRESLNDQSVSIETCFCSDAHANDSVELSVCLAGADGSVVAKLGIPFNDLESGACAAVLDELATLENCVHLHSVSERLN